MAELDYAFVAEYAKVDQQGNLTTVGASFTRLMTEIPSNLLVYVAGRVRASIDQETVPLSVVWHPPGIEESLQFDATLSPRPDALSYGDGRIGLLFAVGTLLPILAEGLCQVEISVDGNLVRRLAFDAVNAAQF